MKKTLTPCASNFCRKAIRAALVPFCGGRRGTKRRQSERSPRLARAARRCPATRARTFAS